MAHRGFACLIGRRPERLQIVRKVAEGANQAAGQNLELRTAAAYAKLGKIELKVFGKEIE